MALSEKHSAYYDRLLAKLESDQRLKLTTEEVLKLGVPTVVGAAIGGVILGPLGAVAGAAIGAYVGGKVVKDFDSMVKAMKELSHDKKKKVVEDTWKLVGEETEDELDKYVDVSDKNRKSLISMWLTSIGDSKA